MEICHILSIQSRPVKTKLTAVPPLGSSRKMFDMLYSMVLKKMLPNSYLNANFDGVLRSWCLESTLTN